MNRISLVIFIFLQTCFFLLPICYSQTISNLRKKTIAFNNDTLTLDTVSIIPNSVIIQTKDGIFLHDSTYSIDPATAQLIIKTNLQEDSLVITYRTFPYNFDKRYYNKDINLIQRQSDENQNPFTFTYNPAVKENIFQFKGLNKSGSIARGITLGNNQDVVVNSSLNLQLAGKLNEEIEIVAAITDENIPIQPEGNTQQIQEFDKVFIKLNHNNGSLIVGDYELTRPNSYFMNFYKKVQGARISSSNIKISPEGNFKTQISLSVAKGKYAKNSFTGDEGNQGPYRLKGNNNESFIIILAGTERVYIDGELLTRGEQHDYTINYNSAEISFMPKRLITKDSRVIIEFEYSDKNYARSLFYLNNEYTHNKLKIKFNMYSEQDSKNKTLQQELTFEEKQLLAGIGDSLQMGVVMNIDSSVFDINKIMYRMIDTLGYDSVFVYSTDPNNAFYQLGFSNVGTNRGNYKQKLTSANGRVFEWNAPVSGIPQGDYEPVILLITPKQQQLYTLGAEYQISKHGKVIFESAVSNNNTNTYSKKDKSDDAGHAFQIALENKYPLSSVKDTTHKKLWYLHTGLSMETANKYFSPLETYRPIEFTRDWNIENLTKKNEENSGAAMIGLSNKNVGNINYSFKSLLSGNEYFGLKNGINSSLKWKGFRFSTNSDILTSNGTIYSSKFIRPKAEISKSFPLLTFGVAGEQQKKSFFKNNSDTLEFNSSTFDLYQIFFQNNDTAQNKFRLDYTRRKDFLPQNIAFKTATLGNTLNFHSEIIKNPNSQLRLGATYRELSIIDTLVTSTKPAQSILSRIEYNFNILKSVITSTIYYELGSGSEQKREFTYVEVQPGQGVYTWTDNNNNGIKELDEFPQAVFQDQANHIKVYLPTNEYIQTFINKFSQSLNLNPANIWKRHKGFKGFVSRFSSQTNFQIDRKILEDENASKFNPFIFEVDDTSLISINSSIRNTLFFNRSNPKWGVELNWQDNRNKILLTNGFDTRIRTEQGFKTRWNMTREIGLIASYNKGIKEFSSEYFSNKNYKIDFFEIEPKLTFQPGKKFRLIFNYLFVNKINSLGSEKSINQEIGNELQINQINKGNLFFKFSYINIAFNGLQNSSVSYEMLEGYQAGNNITWQVSYQKHLANSMQIGINYTGRISEKTNIVHTGGAQVRAMF